MYRTVDFDQIRTERYGPFVIVTASVRSTLRYFTLVLAGSRASKICTVSVCRCHAAQLSTALRLNQRQQLRRRHQDDIAHTLSDVHKAVPRILPCINNVLWKIQ
jgi:hypothetical protein